LFVKQIYLFSIFVVFGEKFNGREATDTIPEKNKTFNITTTKQQIEVMISRPYCEAAVIVCETLISPLRSINEYQQRIRTT